MNFTRQQKVPGRIRTGGYGPVSFGAVAVVLLAVAVARAGNAGQTPSTGTASGTQSTGQTTAKAPAASGTTAAAKPAATPAASKPATKQSASAQKKKKATVRRPLAPEPARIREIQQALAREGYYHGEPTGKWDEASVVAMKQFQEAKGLAPTGKLEALSLQKLGLGSPVAGLAAPEPRPAAQGDPPAAPVKPPR